jgi:hypothetical protein
MPEHRLDATVHCAYHSSMSDAPGPGRHVALVIGIALFAGAGYFAVVGGEPVVATILALIGASALAGWVKSGRPK